MAARPRNVVILGSTGSIGTSALEVIASSGGKLKAYGLSAHQNVQRLIEQARQFQPQWLIATDPDAVESLDTSSLPAGTRLVRGEPGLVEAVSDPAVDVVVAAIVGSAGLRGTWAAIEAGKIVA